MPLAFSLIPAATKLQANGEGQPVDVSASETRTFFCQLTITEQIEQESLDVSIWGSPDGQQFGKKPLLKIPQQFYCGTTKMVLDISVRPEVKFLRAAWELNRWGRVAPTPLFVAALDLTEVPAMRSAAMSAGAIVTQS